MKVNSHGLSGRARRPVGGSAALLVGASTLGLFAAFSGADRVSAQADPSAETQAFVERTCSTCHAYALATAKGHTEREWLTIVNRMVALGAPLNGQQVSFVSAYLAHAYPAPVVSKTEFPPAQAAKPAIHPRPSGAHQWPAYGGGDENQNFSPYEQITPANVANLQPAWTYHYGMERHEKGDQGLDYRFEVTPLIIGGVMYISTPSSPLVEGLRASITALRPETGEVLWKYNSDRNIHGRGIAYWPGDAGHAPRIVFGTDGGFVMAVDVTTGELARDFGRNGAIDAYVGVVSEVVGETRRDTFTIPNPVTVYKNLIITGSRPGEAVPPGPRGDVRAWDARTGRLVWAFHTVPQPGEQNSETYATDEWRDLSGANVWSTMALDEENGIVYAPVGDLNARAEGSELYSNSLIALDADTGELKWYRQITHKDLWDWDMPTPPVLLDVEKDGEKVPGVLLTGKQSLMFLFNRLTGEPLNGFVETPTPGTNIPGVNPWPTQPYPEAPGPLARTTMTRDEIPELVPGMKAHCEAMWDELKLEPGELYSLPQTDRASISFPSSTGGPNWGGGAYSPDLDMFYISLQNRARLNLPTPEITGFAGRPRSTEVLPEEPILEGGGGRGGGGRNRVSFSFTMEDGTVLPCTPTPWGELVAVNIPQRKIMWRAPLGDFQSVPGADTGTYNLGGSMVTAGGLVFVGASNDQRFRAFDARTGQKLWETALEASAHSTPISYVGADGKQYVVVAAGGGTSVGGPIQSDTLVAFALPGSSRGN